MSSPVEHATGLLRSALDPKRATPIETPWGTYALHLVDGDVVCTQAYCPHMEGPLFEGTRSGSRLVCPWHAWIYDLSTGKRVDDGDGAESDERCLKRLEVLDRGADGLVLLPAETS
jgi:nitrite reductase/ring-hydroxylating ferredoxin subunit